MNNYKRLLFTALLSILMTQAHAQFSAAAGGSLMHQFGAPKPMYGFHLQGELCEDDTYSMYGRLAYFPSRAEEEPTRVVLYDLNGNLTAEQADLNFKTNAVGLEGGVRTYLIDGYEFGFAVYGGSKFGLHFFNISSEASGYDRDQYQLGQNQVQKGSVISINAGLSGGVKYSVETFGSIYFDMGLDLRLFSFQNPGGIAENSAFADSGLSFNFALGFRRDLIW